MAVTHKISVFLDDALLHALDAACGGPRRGDLTESRSAYIRRLLSQHFNVAPQMSPLVRHYLRVQDADCKRLCRVIQRHRNKLSPALLRLAELRVERQSYARIAEILNSEGYRTPSGSPWLRETVRHHCKMLARLV